MGNTPTVDPSQVEMQPASPVPAPAPPHNNALMSVLHGALSAIAGPAPPKYSVNPNTGQETQVGGGQSHGLGQILGGLLTGALTGLAGGTKAAAEAPVGAKTAASLAGGFEAEQEQRQQQDQRARAQAAQKFTMQQEAQRTQQEKISEEDRSRAETGQIDLQNMRLHQELHLHDEDQKLELFKAQMAQIEALQKAGYRVTLADDVASNSQPNNGADVMAHMTNTPGAFKDQDGNLRFYTFGPDGTNHVWNVSPTPIDAPRDLTVDEYNMIVPEKYRTTAKDHPDGLVHIDPEVTKALIAQGNGERIANIEAASRERVEGMREKAEKELAQIKGNEAASKEVDSLLKAKASIQKGEFTELNKNLFSRWGIGTPSGKNDADQAIAQIDARVAAIQGLNAPAGAPTGPTATDAKGNKVQWNGKEWAPVQTQQAQTQP